MSHHTLREAAKVGVGLVVADLISALWFSGVGFFPLTILGITWSASALWPIVVFDLAIISLLVHYDWNMKLPVGSPSERGLLKLVGLVFLVVTLLHLLRIAFGWNLILGEVAIPIWLSWFGVIIPGLSLVLKVFTSRSTSSVEPHVLEWRHGRNFFHGGGTVARAIRPQ